MSAHVVVVGSGIAGLVAALHARETGCRVTVVTKDRLGASNTRYAQGGIAGALFPDDRSEDHLRDTLTAAAGLADEDAVRVLVTEGPERIRELIALGVRFDRDADGALRRGREAAHSAARVLHAGGDATGAEIERALVARLRERDIARIEHAFLVDLVTAPPAVAAKPGTLGETGDGALGLAGSPPSRHDAGRVCGVELIVDGDERRVLDADAVILATGGAGHLYAHTTNPPAATADGIAAALRAGATVADLEFVQFHPTVLPADPAIPGPAGESFLVSEAVRGEGAVLIDEQGRRFAFDAHPDGELAPRDIVARAIARTMAAQDGRPVFLDATALGAAFLAERFPTIDRVMRARGLDWAASPIPVTPAAHYLMGGVATDLSGRTTVPGLYAVGETARTGVHGANRLASNSLLEGAVFGARAGDAIAADAQGVEWPPVAATPAPFGCGRDWSFRARASRPDVDNPPASSPNAAEPFSRSALQRLMWTSAGLERTAGGLAHAGSVLAAWRARLGPAPAVAELEDRNLLLVAAQVVHAASIRSVSVGAHFRADAQAAARDLAAAGAAC